MALSWAAIHNINKNKANRGKVSKCLVGRMPRLAGYYSAGVSLRDLEGVWKSKTTEELNIKGREEFKEFIVEWKKHCKATGFELLVYHPGVGSESFRDVSHLHILYSHYKNATKTDFIRDWATSRGYKFWFTRISEDSNGRQRVDSFAKYLRQPPREVLFEKGYVPSREQLPEDRLVSTGPKDIGCEPPMDGGQDVESIDGRSDGLPGDKDGLSGGGQELPKTKSAERKEAIWDRLEGIIRRFRSTDTNMLCHRIYETGNDDLIRWYQHVSTSMDWKQNFEVAVQKYNVWCRSRDWDELLDALPDDVETISEAREHVLTIAQSRAVLKKVLLHQLGDMGKVQEFLWQCYQLMNRKSKKFNCLLLKGPANSAKSWFATGLKRSGHTYYTMGNLGRNASTFIWQSLAKKNIFHFEEPCVDPAHIDELKTILGGQTLDVQQKYIDAGGVMRVPVICTTNHDLWRYSLNDREPILGRCFYYQWHTLPKDIVIGGSLHPKVFKGLNELYGFKERAMPSCPEPGISLSDFDSQYARNLEGFQVDSQGVDRREVEGTRKRQRVDLSGTDGTDDSEGDSDGSTPPDRCGKRARGLLGGQDSSTSRVPAVQERPSGLGVPDDCPMDVAVGTDDNGGGSEVQHGSMGTSGEGAQVEHAMASADALGIWLAENANDLGKYRGYFMGMVSVVPEL